MIDFTKTVDRIRKLARDCGIDHPMKADHPVSRVLWDVERELAVQSVCYLYEHLTTRNQFVRACALLADALPMGVEDDPRVRAAMHHALGSTTKLDTADTEALRAKEGVYIEADHIAAEAQLPPRAAYWLHVVRLTGARLALEYGSGHGMNVLGLARHEPRVGWRGCDVNYDQVVGCSAQANRLGVPVGFFQDGAENAARFDAVALLHVLEHTARPTEVLDRAERYVRPAGGTVTVIVPCDAAPTPPPTEVQVAAIREGRGEERGHINSMSIAALIELIKPRGKIIDAQVVATEPHCTDSCVVYVPGVGS